MSSHMIKDDKRCFVALRIVGKQDLKMGWKKGRPRLSHKLSPGRSLLPRALGTAVCTMGGVPWKTGTVATSRMNPSVSFFFELLIPN